ncbi:MAG: Stk1 family PASTA domain-containing Ser/Thr kinase [Coriobacteriia bacterium]|nr:Stk1 family PASTA domain-containing Ser/Thr kinase [Coriobacteriia bacterium]
MATDMIGRVFSGRYKLVERIGTGGMAEVYRAEDTVLGRVVAVKVMLPQYAADKEFTDRFRQEAASAANLQNPYIVNIYDWGQDGDDYFIVMEYVRGSDLKSGIKAKGAIGQRKVAEIASQVCQALATAHAQDIMHRDIKPQNIMVQPDGNAKVMDFGIARAKNSVKTHTSSVLGTAHYISPEQAQGKEITQSSDIYSLGCVMYEAVTGKLPFDGEDAVAVAMKQVNEKPAAPRSIKPDIDPDLEKIIGMAMNKDPQKRFATARDMQNALQDYLAGRPVRFGSSADKTAVIAGIGGAAAGVAAGAAMAGAAYGDSPDKTGVMSPEEVQQRAQKNYRADNTGKKPKKPEKTPEQKAAARKKRLIIFAIIAVILAAAAIFVFVVMKGVPNVVGKHVDDAKTEITEANFEVGDITEEFNPEVEKDHVISQNPGWRAFEHDKINLVVSKGAEMVEVPDVKDKTRSEATDILERAGFKVELTDDAYDKDIEAGKVCKQDPEGKTQAPKGSTVKITVSKGVEKGDVPNVVNYSEADAVAALKAAGFEVSIKREYSDSVDEGFVMAQSPSSGQKADKGSAVTITVSRGSGQVTVPNVVGMDYDSAKSTLQSVGLNVATSGGGNKVISQNPVSGNKVAQGTTVTLTLGSNEAITVLNLNIPVFNQAISFFCRIFGIL